MFKDVKQKRKNEKGDMINFFKNWKKVRAIISSHESNTYHM